MQYVDALASDVGNGANTYCQNGKLASVLRPQFSLGQSFVPSFLLLQIVDKDVEIVR